jgi:hypothetical protein
VLASGWQSKLLGRTHHQTRMMHLDLTTTAAREVIMKGVPKGPEVGGNPRPLHFRFQVLFELE